MDVLSLKTNNDNNNKKQCYSESKDCLSAVTDVKLFGLSPSLHPREAVPVTGSASVCGVPSRQRLLVLAFSPTPMVLSLDSSTNSHSFCLRLGQQGFLSTLVSTRFTERLLGSTPGCLRPVYF